MLLPTSAHVHFKDKYCHFNPLKLFLLLKIIDISYRQRRFTIRLKPAVVLDQFCSLNQSPVLFVGKSSLYPNVNQINSTR